MLESYELTRDYFDEYGDADRVTLRFYLKGKPDNAGWRELFRQSDTIPVAHNGRIFPQWALLDLYKLMQIQPGIEREILHETSIEELPPLEVVVKTLHR